MDHIAPVTSPHAADWWHETTLGAGTALGKGARGKLARSFVRQHLVSHRLFHLLDATGVVAFRLAEASASTRRAALRLELSRRGENVLLTLDEAPGGISPPGDSLKGLDPGVGFGIVELLTLQWGTTSTDATTTGLWATFTARDPRRADAAPPQTLTRGPANGTTGGSDPW